MSGTTPRCCVLAPVIRKNWAMVSLIGQATALDPESIGQDQSVLYGPLSVGRFADDDAAVVILNRAGKYFGS